MKHKVFFAIIIIGLLFTVSSALAYETQETLPNPGITPDSPWYFLDQLFDQLRTIFTLNPEARVKLHLSIANERLAEMKLMIQNKKDQASDRAARLFEQRAQKAQDTAEESGKESLVKLVKESYLKHIAVLERIKEQAPEQAQKGLERALENARRLREKKIEFEKRKEEKQAKRDEGEDEEKEDGEMVVCTAQYDPVCGVNGKTYANTCIAESQQKVKIAYKGECLKTTVVYSDRGFAPSKLNIKKGEAVTWLNKSANLMRVASAIHPTHAVYPVSGGCIGSIFDACKEINPEESWSFMFDQVGTWKYHNHLNPSQTGTVVVAE